MELIGGKSFDDIVKQYHRLIFSRARYIVRNNTDAEDVAQDVYLKIFTKGDKFKEGSDLKTWIYAITTNTAIDHLRRNKNNPLRKPLDLETYPHPSYIPRDLVEENEDMKQLANSFDVLTDKEKDVLDLFIIGNEYSEIAEKLGMPGGTVRSTIFRIRGKLTTQRRMQYN